MALEPTRQRRSKRPDRLSVEDPSFERELQRKARDEEAATQKRWAEEKAAEPADGEDKSAKEGGGKGGAVPAHALAASKRAAAAADEIMAAVKAKDPFKTLGMEGPTADALGRPVRPSFPKSLSLHIVAEAPLFLAVISPTWCMRGYG